MRSRTPANPTPSVVEVDLLDENAQNESRAHGDRSSIAYLQYTSGSTRQPAGAMISHKNLRVNIKQFISDYMVEYGNVAPPDTTLCRGCHSFMISV